MLSARAENPFAGDGVLAHDRPLGLVQRARLAEDAVRHRNLADVVELGGADQHVQRFGIEPHAATDGGRERSDLVVVGVEIRLALGHDADQQVASLLAAGAAAAALARVHALVGEAERLGRVLGVLRKHDQAVGGRDLEAVAVRAERVDGALDERIAVVERAFDQQAELVTAEAVGRPPTAASAGASWRSSASPAG